MKKSIGFILPLASVFVLSTYIHATTITPIDLNDFFADPSVTVSPDGTTATMDEDPYSLQVILNNFPAAGDPNVIIPGVGVSLIFKYDFNEGETEPTARDEFVAMVTDGTTGFSAGDAFEFMTDTTSAGQVSFDLTDLTGETLGLSFVLYDRAESPAEWNRDYNASAVISYVRLESQPIPIPGAAWLLGSGLIGLIGLRRKFKK